MNSVARALTEKVIVKQSSQEVRKENFGCLQQLALRRPWSHDSYKRHLLIPGVVAVNRTV